MVKNGHPAAAPISDIGYRNPHCPALGIDVRTLADARAHAPGPGGGGPQRLDFHLLVLVTHGHGTHMIDFIGHDCRPGTLLWIRPGQVHAYARAPELEARLVLFTPDFPPPLRVQPLLDDPFAPAHWQTQGRDRAHLTRLTGLLAAAHDAHAADSTQAADPAHAVDPGALTTDLLRHTLAALLLRIALLPEPEGEPAPTGPGELFTRFRAALERDFAAERSVAAYATRLATTPKTLTRVCLTAAGRPAKALIDDRVVLEAKRLLVHTDLSAAAVGRRLGFSEAANFGKFFLRRTGRTPGEFRAAL
ncbi:AraC family transcriptional regulator [Streptomyces sp. NPDC059063]|uniref:AraC family transcriptional regulator n=1 Tax=unclassified Streptomyces TaxID=2593676 RepID=UPI003687291B